MTRSHTLKSSIGRSGRIQVYSILDLVLATEKRETLRNICKTQCIRHEIVQLVGLSSFRMRLAIVWVLRVTGRVRLVKVDLIANSAVPV